MKLLMLHVENYGHYSDQRFDFAPECAEEAADPANARGDATNGDGAGGFCLIHGENEAGKTTLLQLIREVLFGIHARTPYDFGYKGEVAAELRAVLRDGRRLRARRRKGNKDRLVGEFEGGHEPFDEAAFERLLGAGPDLYHNVFAFSQGELAAGQKSLETAGLTEALYGGGMGGLARFQELKKSVTDEHAALFKPSGQKPVINGLLRTLREGADDLNAAAADPREFERLGTERARAEEEVDRLGLACGELARRHDALKRNQRCLPGWLALRVLREELDRIDLPPAFPVDEIDRFDRLQKRLGEIDGDVTRLTAELSVQESRAEGDESPDGAAILEFEPRIRELGKDENRIRAMLADLPKRREEAGAILDEVTRRTRSLDADWTIDDLDRFASSTSDRTRLKHLATRQTELDKQLATESRSLRDLEIRRDQVQSRLDQLSANERLDGLEALLDLADGYRRRVERLAEVRAEITDLDAATAEQCGRLQRLVGGTFDDPTSLPVPLVATVEAFGERLRGHDELCRRAGDRAEAATEERAACAEAIAALNGPGAPPDTETLKAARLARDAAWREIRLRAEAGEPSTVATLADFEQAITRADRFADDRCAHAEELARREQLERDLVRFDRRRSEADDDLAEAERERDAAVAEWATLWEACGFAPLAPAAMREWLTEFTAWRTNLLRRGELAAEAERLAGPVEEFEQELGRAFSDADGSTEAALGRAVRERDAARVVERDRAKLLEDLPNIEANLRDAERTCERLRSEQQAWETERRETLRALGLPEGWRIDDAQLVLGEVAELLVSRGKGTERAGRVADMTAQLEEFDRRVREVADGEGETNEVGEVSVEARARTGLEVVARLVQRCDGARGKQTKREAFAESRRETTAKLDALGKERGQLVGERNALMQAAGVEDPGTFAALAKTAWARREIVEQIARTERELRTAFGATDIETCATELDGLDEDELARQLETVRADLAEREAERSRAAERLGAAKDRLRALDCENESGEIASRIEGARAELVAAVDRWAPRVLVERLVTRALERFERDHQPEMLLEVSRLFGRMTRGRYVGLERKVFDNGRLFVQQGDGTTKEPSQLSTGAREQLYLSIRLAYAIKYCRTAEPLPLVMDDVLVNFDAERTRATLEVLREVSQQVQVLFLTCHRHVVELVRELVPEHRAVELPAHGQPSDGTDSTRGSSGASDVAVDPVEAAGSARGAGRRGKRAVAPARGGPPPLFPDA